MLTPHFFKLLTVLSYTHQQGEYTEVTTVQSGHTIHWIPNGEGWIIDYIQRPDGEIINR